jgi:hypothetical protein
MRIPPCIRKRLAIALFGGCISICAQAESPCPDGLTFVGRMERMTNGLEVKERVSITVPSDLDTSYRQPSPSGKGGGAGSTLPQEVIPAGIHIIPSGRGSYGWAVSNPTLTGNTFTMYMYCSQDQGALNTNFGCTVAVDVCVKQAY